MTTTRETMTYNQGKIYKIEPIVEHDEGDIYIGSTCCKYLSQRLKSHRWGYTAWKNGKKKSLTTSYNLFEKYGLENCQILLIESICCEDINELRTREAFYIRSLKCVNKAIPLRSQKEYDADNREKSYEYRLNHKQDKYEYDKQYREANREKISERKRLKTGKERSRKQNIDNI